MNGTARAAGKGGVCGKRPLAQSVKPQVFPVDDVQSPRALHRNEKSDVSGVVKASSRESRKLTRATPTWSRDQLKASLEGGAKARAAADGQFRAFRETCAGGGTDAAPTCTFGAMRLQKCP